jgi:hypothetical protein
MTTLALSPRSYVAEKGYVYVWHAKPRPRSASRKTVFIDCRAVFIRVSEFALAFFSSEIPEPSSSHLAHTGSLIVQPEVRLSHIYLAVIQATYPISSKNMAQCLTEVPLADLETDHRPHWVLPSGNDGNVLHTMCQEPRTTFKQVRDIIEHHPQAASTLDAFGRPPIYYALRSGCTPEIVLLLFRVASDMLGKQDFCGASGLSLLYCAGNKQRTDILQAVLQQQPTLALFRPTSFSSKRLVDRICDNWTNNNAQTEDAWFKLVLTVKAAHRATFKNDQIDTDEELHLALELGLSTSLLCNFAQKFPKQACRPMKRRQGSLPLHHVANCKVMARSKGIESLIRCLLAACPQAAGVRHQGRLALHIALSNGFNWTTGVQDMTFAYHDALHSHDPSSRLYPFQLASSSQECDLNTVYMLLRESPKPRC